MEPDFARRTRSPGESGISASGVALDERNEDAGGLVGAAQQRYLDRLRGRIVAAQ